MKLHKILIFTLPFFINCAEVTEHEETIAIPGLANVKQEQPAPEVRKLLSKKTTPPAIRHHKSKISPEKEALIKSALDANQSYLQAAKAAEVTWETVARYARQHGYVSPHRRKKLSEDEMAAIDLLNLQRQPSRAPSTPSSAPSTPYRKISPKPQENLQPASKS